GRLRARDLGGEPAGLAGRLISVVESRVGGGFVRYGWRDSRRTGKFFHRLDCDAFHLRAHFHLRRSVAPFRRLLNLDPVAGTIFPIKCVTVWKRRGSSPR